MKRKSDSIGTISKSLLKAQTEIGKVSKDGYNPHFKSKFADLTSVIEAIKKPLNENEICFLQLVDISEDASDKLPFVETVLLHESGEWISSRTPVYCTKPNNPQALGTGISYAKRYALQAIMGLPTEDDDGNAASGAPVSNNQTPVNNNEEFGL